MTAPADGLNALAAINYAMAPADSKLRRSMDAQSEKANRAAQRRAARSTPQARIERAQRKITKAHERVTWEQAQADDPTLSERAHTFHAEQVTRWNAHIAALHAHVEKIRTSS